MDAIFVCKCRGKPDLAECWSCSATQWVWALTVLSRLDSGNVMELISESPEVPVVFIQNLCYVHKLRRTWWDCSFPFCSICAFTLCLTVCYMSTLQRQLAAFFCWACFFYGTHELTCAGKPATISSRAPLLPEISFFCCSLTCAPCF